MARTPEIRPVWPILTREAAFVKRGVPGEVVEGRGMAILDDGEGLNEGEGEPHGFPGLGGETGAVGGGAIEVPTEVVTLVAPIIETTVVSCGGWGTTVVSAGGITIVGPADETTVVSIGGGITVVGAAEETTVVSIGGGTTVVPGAYVVVATAVTVMVLVPVMGMIIVEVPLMDVEWDTSTLLGDTAIYTFG